MHVLCSSHDESDDPVCSMYHILYQTSCQSTYGYALLILNTRLHEVFPFLWSIREMSCIIFMLGRDAHINAYLSHVIVLHLHISLMNCYCPLQLKRENSQVNP